jgi:serine/threonine-protein kinase
MMLGDFGEVYVLDWGIAKLVHDEEPEFTSEDAAPRVKHATESGVVLGTPGYMAPEQIRGDALDARTDVFALGAILFEIICGEPLHVGTNLAMMASQTLCGSSERVRTLCRERDVPPELEEVCVRATMVDPAAPGPDAATDRGTINPSYNQRVPEQSSRIAGRPAQRDPLRRLD